MSYLCGKIYADIEQGTPEWDTVRCGKASGSHMDAVTMDAKKSGKRNYRARLISERITKEVEESYSNANMDHGIEQEPFARSVYEFHKNVEVVEVGFIDHPHINMSGSSPDGLVGEDGSVEIKCPVPATHIDTMLTGKIPSKYIKQMQWLMACSGRLWCDFVSYCPKLGVDLQLHVILVERDDAMIKELETEVTLLNDDVSSTIEALLARNIRS